MRRGSPRTLQEIYEFMKLAAEQKWGKRFMRKTTIESAIADYHAALDDAARAFQVSQLNRICLPVLRSLTLRPDFYSHQYTSCGRGRKIQENGDC